MAFLPANLTRDSVIYVGGLLDGTRYKEAAEITSLNGGTLAALDTSVGVTANMATKNGWTRLSQQNWGYVGGDYAGPVVELSEQDGPYDAVYRQSLMVADLEWSFTIDVNTQTLALLGGVRQELRRFIVADLGVASGTVVDQFVAWLSAPTGANNGKKQFRCGINGHGPVTQYTLA